MRLSLSEETLADLSRKVGMKYKAIWLEDDKAGPGIVKFCAYKMNEKMSHY